MVIQNANGIDLSLFGDQLYRVQDAYINPHRSPSTSRQCHDLSLPSTSIEPVSKLAIEDIAKSEQQHSNISTHPATIKAMTRNKQALAKGEDSKTNPVEVSNPVQPQQTMAGLGDLAKIPGELRNKIYEMVLAEPASIKLQSYEPRRKIYHGEDGEATSRHPGDLVAPVDHKRNAEHRGQRWVAGKWVEVPSKTALVQVNKALNAETSSMLYSSNSFEFTSTLALERFLKQIGDNAQFLRSVGLQWVPTFHNMSAGLRAMKALLVAKSLHTVSITNLPVHHDKLVDVTSPQVRNYLREHVKMCLPVLESRRADSKADGQSLDISDILKVVPRLPGGQPHHNERDCVHMFCGRQCKFQEHFYHLDRTECDHKCMTSCDNASLRSKLLKMVLQIEVVKQLPADKANAKLSSSA